MSLQIGFPYSTKCEKEKSNRHVYIIIPLLIIQCSIFSNLLSTKTKLFSALLTFSDLWIYPSVCVQACIHAKSFQSCPSLCSPSGSSVHGILQGRILEWIAMPSSRWFSQPRDQSRASYASCIGRWWVFFVLFCFVLFLCFTTTTTWEGQIYSSDQISHSFMGTLCDPMNRSTPGLPVQHQLPEFTQTHVHRVSDAIQPSHPLLSPSPPAPNPCQHQSLFQWVNSSHEVAKVLEFQL